MANRQTSIPGTEAPRIKEIDVAAEAYEEARDERMELTKTEDSAKQALIAVMKKHGIDVYRDESVDPPIVIHVEPGDPVVKVKRVKPPKDDEDEKEE